MKVRFGANEIEVGTLDQLDELVMRYGGTAVSIRLRVGAVDIEVGTVAQLDELVRRYGGISAAPSTSPGPWPKADHGGSGPTAGSKSDGAPTGPAEPGAGTV
jgi:hypothetical protein